MTKVSRRFPLRPLTFVRIRRRRPGTSPRSRKDYAPPGPPADPEWARCFLSGVTLPVADMPHEAVERRRAHFAESGLSSYDEIPANLLRPGHDGMRTLMRWTLALLGEAIVPIANYHLAISIGRLLYRIVAKSLVRIGCPMQMIGDCESDRWTVVETDYGTRPGFRAVPKLHHEARLLPFEEKVVSYGLDLATAAMVGELIRLLLEVDGADPADPARLRIVEPAANLPDDCGPDRYLFQFSGQPLDASGLAHCMGHLFGRRVLAHDARDGGSARSYGEGRTVEQVGVQLGHRRPPQTKRYIRRGNGQMPGEGARMLVLRDQAQAVSKGGSSRRGSGRRR